MSKADRMVTPLTPERLGEPRRPVNLSAQAYARRRRGAACRARVDRRCSKKAARESRSGPARSPPVACHGAHACCGVVGGIVQSQAAQPRVLALHREQRRVGGVGPPRAGLRARDPSGRIVRAQLARDAEDGHAIVLPGIAGLTRKRQGPALARRPLVLLVGRVGFEPTTNGLRVRCSTS